AAARRLRKPAAVAFLSPHLALRRFWVDREYARFPELSTTAGRRLRALATSRDARRDEEARLADVVYANSAFTARSLTAAGFSADKIVTVAPGCPPAIPDDALLDDPPAPRRVIYAGSVSVEKGVHHLLDGWGKLGGRERAQLHLYGRLLLPARCLA